MRVIIIIVALARLAYANYAWSTLLDAKLNLIAAGISYVKYAVPYGSQGNYIHVSLIIYLRVTRMMGNFAN